MNETDPQTSGDHIEVGDIKNAQAVAIGAGATAVYQGLTVEEVATLVVKLKHKDQPTVWNGRIPTSASPHSKKATPNTSLAVKVWWMIY